MGTQWCHRVAEALLERFIARTTTGLPSLSTSSLKQTCLFLCLNLALEGSPSPRTWVQREGRVRHDRMIRYEVHLVLLDNGRQNQLGFDHGELAANADPRSTPEGEVGEAWAVGRYFSQETLRSDLSGPPKTRDAGV